MKKAQIVKKKCCGVVFAACLAPDCYQDKEWQRDVRKYSKQGHTVEEVERFEFGDCKCLK